MRTLWKGAVSFGLVNIPIKMYVATENKDLKFKYLHEKCMSPVQYRKYCPNCDREIIPEEIVRGYEYQKGSYVIINEEDLARIPLETTKTIDILDFVQLDQVDPIYFDKTYYLEPSPGGEKAYTLIIEAMKRTNKVAIAKVIIRSKQSLAALRVKDKTLIMETIFYPDEIRSPDSLSSGVDVSKLHDNEIKMAVNLIENLSVNFDPGKYEDEYRKALWELIEGKIVGREVSHVQVSEPTNVVDLMEALKASVELAQQQHKKTSPRKPGSKSTKKASTGT
ncbi:MAG: Ku protein [Syntrophomonadaceae bacterium]|nr:Ku protein [Syntrophomonadaceae bacterium]